MERNSIIFQARVQKLAKEKVTFHRHQVASLMGSCTMNLKVARSQMLRDLRQRTWVVER
jgi:hypothetical protein